MLKMNFKICQLFVGLAFLVSCSCAAYSFTPAVEITNYVFASGVYYATIDNWPTNTSVSGCQNQNTYYALPQGFSVVNITSDTVALSVIRASYWGTAALITIDGSAYGTLSQPTNTYPYAWLDVNGTSYRNKVCSTRVFIRSTSLAQTTDVQTTDVQTTDVQTTDVQTTDVQTTDVQTTGVQTTDVQTTNVQTTDVQTTDVQTTDVQTTDVQTTDVQTTGVQTTDVQTTDAQTTAVQTTNVQTTSLQTTVQIRPPGGFPAANLADTESGSTKSDGTLSGGQIAGIVIGTIAFVAIVIAEAVYLTTKPKPTVPVTSV